MLSRPEIDAQLALSRTQLGEGSGLAMFITLAGILGAKRAYDVNQVEENAGKAWFVRCGYSGAFSREHRSGGNSL
ncbi:uncharacterized protein F4807DRAFT_461983 [Annulohypoxylon truncatum]|uniref:uncharacterized protein n=1 Tax=Annulohypoxylon truncatum TaxID=327061 RepID=UPI002007959C|nr:uncharacterized protein F4807DRAFT_461983 [Annulohypoxylon truncatum]KAI1208261.1 hypothetical protein F4807DRAFT_461983 [Annulohypoxylon truncatum]